MTKIMDKDGFEWSIKFFYVKNPEENPLAQVRTYCSMRKTVDESVTTKVEYCDCSKKDKYDKRLGMKLAFQRCIKKITDDKNERLILWKEFFKHINDPHRTQFFNYYYGIDDSVEDNLVTA